MTKLSYAYNKMDEMILCAPKSTVMDIIGDDTVVTDQERVEKILLHYANNSIAVRRGDAEQDFTLKQLIPYILLVKNDSIFLYERLSGGGEKRLVGSSSVGVGGHMNLINNDPYGLVNNIYVDAERELNEELILSMPIDVSDSKIYILNDESNEVGAVHLGAVLMIQVPETLEVEVRETEQLSGSFKAFHDIDADLLENWSKIVLSELNLLA